MKQILYFFPLNPADKNSGSISRALGLLKYFASRGMKVDFITKKDWGNYTPESMDAFKKMRLAENIWVLRRKPVKTNPIRYFFGYKIHHLLFERKLRKGKGSIPNHTTLFLRQQFDAILKCKSYDIVIISYAYWADLVKDNPYLGAALTILDTHDLLSSQHQRDAGFNKGNALADELRRLELFQQIWTVSTEETYFFSQFFGARVKYIPMMLDDPQKEPRPDREKKFDLIYVATDNPHNLTSAAWFFKEVFPLLARDIRICVIGTILSNIPEDVPGVTRVEFAEMLDEYYGSSRVAICPMLTGTGLKIKVVEAMAHGLPVVCNERGVDGIPDKSNNGCLVTNSPKEFAMFIGQLLEDANLYQNQVELGRACFLRHFERTEIYKRIDKVLNLFAHEEKD